MRFASGPAAVTALFLSITTAAAEWPERAITVVSPYPPGGTNDVIGRAFMDRPATKLGQPIVVDNKPGAAGIVGSAQVARAKPDGYTLLTANNGALVLQPLVNSQARYSPVTDFTPIARYAVSYPFLGVRPEFPVADFGAFTTLLKTANPGLTYGSAGIGSFGQFAVGHLVSVIGGGNPVHIPYRGSSQALTDLLAGRIDFMVDPVVLQQKGPVRVLVTTAPERIATYPDVPTSREAGFPEFNLFGWFGLFGPSGLPPDIVEKLGRAIDEIAAEDNIKAVAERTGLSVAPLRGPPFVAALRDELARFSDIKQKAGIPNIE
jgi:tripartite-type tricarboxylate transporter receptor subunit TctC